jgi:hypothetical protein
MNMPGRKPYSRPVKWPGLKTADSPINDMPWICFGITDSLNYYKEYGGAGLSDFFTPHASYDCVKSLILRALWHGYLSKFQLFAFNSSNKKYRPKNIFAKPCFIYGRHSVWGKHLPPRREHSGSATIFERHH